MRTIVSFNDWTIRVTGETFGEIQAKAEGAVVAFFGQPTGYPIQYSIHEMWTSGIYEAEVTVTWESEAIDDEPPF